jgi:hypothetical protein
MISFSFYLFSSMNGMKPPDATQLVLSLAFRIGSIALQITIYSASCIALSETPTDLHFVSYADGNC